MDKQEFVRIRKKLGKTQKEMSVLLNISTKSVESYEQGFRNIPVNVARLLYFMLFKIHHDVLDLDMKCWEQLNCPQHKREKCMAWLAEEGFFCWSLTGKSCLYYKGSEKPDIDSCFECIFFKENLAKIDY